MRSFCVFLCLFFLNLPGKSKGSGFEAFFRGYPNVEHEVESCLLVTMVKTHSLKLSLLKSCNKFMCPTARSLATYVSLKRISKTDQQDIFSFFNKYHENWPSTITIRKNSEKFLRSLTPSVNKLSLFCGTPPRTMEGILFCTERLKMFRSEEESRIFVRRSFVELDFLQDQNKYFLLRFHLYLKNQDYFNRVERLIIKGDLDEIKSIIPHIDSSKIPYIKLRLSLKKGEENAEKLLDPYREKLKTDNDLTIDYLTWLQHKATKRLDEIFMRSESFTRYHSYLVWKERLANIRKAITEKNPERAYDIGKNHGLIDLDGDKYFEAEWIMGWLSLSYLHDPRRAIRHFSHLKLVMRRPESVTRAQYWLARSYSKLMEEKESSSLYRRAAKYNTTYYGQASKDKMKPTFESVFLVLPEIKVSSRTFLELEKRLSVKASNILYSFELNQEAQQFTCSLMSSKIPFDHERAIFMITKSASRYYSLGSELVSTYLRDIPHVMSYPILGSYDQSSILCEDAALVHAVIRQESLFNKEARSRTGAFGLMQVMPETAESISKRISSLRNKDVSSSRSLTNQAMNIKLGSYYLQDQLDVYNGSRLAALAAYNAGPSTVTRWIKTFGKPRVNLDNLDPDWIERLPFKETRDYIMKSLSSYAIYLPRLNSLKTDKKN